MAGDKKRKHDRRKLEHQSLRSKFEDLHSKGIFLKRILRQRGVDLPFYDFYDSYFDEFGKVAAKAKEVFPSLLGIFEVDDGEYFGTERSQFAPGMEQIFWHTEEEQNGYGTGTANDKSNVNGYTCAFRASDGRLRTVVVIRRTVPKSKPHREHKYVMKLVALLHELGHVHDMEREINFNHTAKTFDVIEAEVFAHLFALQRMAQQNYFHCYGMLLGALKQARTSDSYLADVAKSTVDRMPHYQLIDVQKIPLTPVSLADLKALGPDGRKAFGFKN